MAGGKFPSKTSGLAYSNFPQISNVERQGISVRKSKLSKVTVKLTAY